MLYPAYVLILALGLGKGELLGLDWELQLRQPHRPDRRFQDDQALVVVGGRVVRWQLADGLHLNGELGADIMWL